MPIAVLLLLALSTQAASFACPKPGLPPFSCKPHASVPPATDVLHLRPGNIEAVIALGDSITAGFGMEDLPVEYRGLVYSTGGDADAFTLGNFLKVYNKDLKGQCTGTTVPLSRGKGLNVAVSGAVVRDIPGQIDHLLKVMQEPEYAGLMDKWKLVTLFIGANDVCDCHRTTAEGFGQELTDALTKLEAVLPRSFVNLVTLFNISQVWDESRDKRYCSIAVPILHECGCLTSNKAERTAMDELGLRVNAVKYQVAANFAAKGNRNFTVVVQPGVDQLPLATYGPEGLVFLSPVDCFHPSLCADEGFALAFWNNMFTKASNKQHTLDPFHPPPFICPGDSDYIQ